MTSIDKPIPLPWRTPGAGRVLKRCYGYLRPYWRWTLGVYLLVLALNGLSLWIPQVIREAVDRGMRGGDMAGLGQAVLLLLGLTMLKGLMAFFQGRWVEKSSQGVAYDLRNEIHLRLSALSFSYHDRAEAGQLLSRSIQDVERIRFLTGRATLRLVEGAALFIGTGIVLVTMNPWLALVAVGGLPLVTYQAFNFGRRFRPISQSLQNQMGVLTSFLEQNLRGARIVKAFAQEDAETVRFEGHNRRWFSLASQSARLEATNAPLIDLIANLELALILWYGGSLVISGQLTPGALVAFFTYLSQLVQPVRRIGTIVPAVAQAIVAGERIFEILDASSEVQERPGALPLPRIEGRVSFEQVSFSYFGRHSALRELTFEAQPGEVIALLGTTGSGKSTIINLIPRFYDPTAGRIRVDGHDLREVTINSLRDQIGIVLQETTLFVASVRENIAFGRPGAGMAEIEAAARAAQAHDFIMAMPEGYETPVGERGVTLSGGQKQRIAIARALLKDPRILILDDAMASVDSETEHLIQKALERLMEGRTTFVIAQRLSTVRRADCILLLDKGRIAARGTHEELLCTSGLYAEIYRRQLQPAQEQEESL